MLSTDDILTAAIGRQHDTSTALRAKAVYWLNEAIQLLVHERRWSWLEKTATISIASDTATLPDDFDRFVFVKTDDWYLERHKQLSKGDAELDTDTDLIVTDDPIPYGFVISSTAITFHAGCSDDTGGSLTYIQTVPDYTDSTDDTILPDMCKPLLVRSLVSALYEYDKDPRGIPSIQLDAMLLSKLKKRDNAERPLPRYGKYLRNNL